MQATVKPYDHYHGQFIGFADKFLQAFKGRAKILAVDRQRHFIKVGNVTLDDFEAFQGQLRNGVGRRNPHHPEYIEPYAAATKDYGLIIFNAEELMNGYGPH